MNKSRSTVVFGSLILVVLIAAGWFLLLSPRMGKPGEIRAEQDQVAAVNATTEASIKDLQEKQKQLPQAREYASRLAERFPSTAAQAEMFEMVRDAARAAGIPEQNITDLTPSVPAIGGALDGSVTLPETAADPAAEPAADPNAAPAANPSAAPAAGSTPPPAAAGGGQLAVMTVDITVSGSKTQLVKFVTAVENMERSYLVDSVMLGSLAEGPGGGGKYTVTVTGKMFSLKAPVDPEAPVTPAAETPTQ